MLDTISLLAFFGFFAFLIYATVFRHPKAPVPVEPARRRAPSPVGLYCEICGEHAGVVTTEEYERVTLPVYCNYCKMVIERYETQRS